MSNWDLEMQKALEADGEKLRRLTGEDHGPFRLPSNAVDWVFERANADGDHYHVEVMIHYDIEPYVPAKISGPPEDCYPAEGGCVTDMVATKVGSDEIVELSPEETKEVTDWIEQHHDHDADRQGDPDAAYDSWRDDQWQRADEPAGWDD
jgi:hypothetical protein